MRIIKKEDYFVKNKLNTKKLEREKINKYLHSSIIIILKKKFNF